MYDRNVFRACFGRKFWLNIRPNRTSQKVQKPNLLFFGRNRHFRQKQAFLGKYSAEFSAETDEYSAKNACFGRKPNIRCLQFLSGSAETAFFGRIYLFRPKLQNLRFLPKLRPNFRFRPKLEKLFRSYTEIHDTPLLHLFHTLP